MNLRRSEDTASRLEKIRAAQDSYKAQLTANHEAAEQLLRKVRSDVSERVETLRAEATILTNAADELVAKFL